MEAAEMDVEGGREGWSPDQLVGNPAVRSGISTVSLVVTLRNRTMG